MSLDCNTRVGVLVASCGRPAELGELLDRLDRQTLTPKRVVLSVVDPSDRLEFKLADLTDDAGWDSAMAGVDRVLVPVMFTKEFKNIVRGPDDLPQWRDTIERFT